MDSTVSPSSTESCSINCDDVIPPTHPARTLVLCFDGTGDSFDADNSNVVQFFSMLKKDDTTQQMTYYQAGIGTYTTPEIATPGMAKLSKTLDMMIAWNLNAHVMEGYEFLMQNYTAGDKICIFGFSRGAYTARALAGMVHKVGLLPRCNHQQIPFAYKMFTRADETGWKQSTAFKKAFSMDVDIEFIGVWDTVNAVGIVPHRLPFTASNSSIRTFRHAVSLDEHRARFRANLYNRPTARESELGTKTGDMPKAGVVVAQTREDTAVALNHTANGATAVDAKAYHTSQRHTHKPHPCFRAFERAFDANEKTLLETDVLEGVVCRVSYGRHNLARIPLRWMIRQCFLANTGIRFHGTLLHAIGLDPTSLYPIVKTRPPAMLDAAPSTVARSVLTPAGTTEFHNTTKTLVNATGPSLPLAKSDTVALGYNDVHPASIGILSEEEEDLADALCPVYDQLRLRPLWWILEVIPMKLRTQREDDNEWVRRLTVNLGRPRSIPNQKRNGIHIHRSVKIRMQAGNGVAGGKYAPRAKWKVEPNWVD